MKKEVLDQALNGIRDRYVMEAALYDPATDSGKETKMYGKNVKPRRRWLRTLLIAAVVVCLLTATAYAAGLLGPRAILIDDGQPVYEYQRQEDGSWEVTENPEGGRVSLTQPQEAPEDMDPAVVAKLENSKAAWAEWSDYKASRPMPQEPEAFRMPTGAFFSDEELQSDGSGILRFYSAGPIGDDNGSPVYDPDTLIEERTVTSEDYEAWDEYISQLDAMMLFESRYDFNYGCNNAEDEAVLEEIAARYGLKLRGGSTLLWSWETVKESRERMDAETGTSSPEIDFSGPQWLTNAELTDRIAQVGCHGAFFYQVPDGYDKFYYFDEGTFCVSWYYTLENGTQITCYGYNSMYGTLSSGTEVVDQVGDRSAFTERSHVCPDGTEVTILRNGNRAFIYVYLPESFFNEEIQGAPGMSDADLDAIADAICYSNIGK